MKMLHRNDDGTYGISSYQTWRPGVYVDASAARRAFRLRDEVLTKLQAEANRKAGGTGGAITTAAVQDAIRKQLPRPPACQ